jgi:hypothetical protein
MIRVRKSTIIDAPVEAAWAILRDFNSHADVLNKRGTQHFVTSRG